jgi:hypothetical protein
MSTDKIVAINEYELEYDDEGNLIQDDKTAKALEEQYASASDETEDETEEVVDDEGSDDDDGLPTKFKGKSPEDIARAYAELEKDRSRLANEVGDLRKLTREILERDAAKSTTTSDDIEEELSFDENPEDYIKKIVQDAVKPLQESTEKTSYEQRFAKFNERHPDFMEIGQDPEFAKYVAAAPHRVAQYEKAQRQDLDAADALLTDYKELRQQLKAAAKQEATEDKAQRKQRIRKASPETGSSGATTGKIYKSSELIRMQMTDPERYAAEQDEIMRAYAEGRVK